jgi:ribonucleoside-diphosphate reductase beta chain
MSSEISPQIESALALSVSALAQTASQFVALSASLAHLAGTLSHATPPLSVAHAMQLAPQTAAPQTAAPQTAAPQTAAPSSHPATLLCAADKKESAFLWADGEADRLSLRPIRHKDIWAFRKKLSALHWDSDEVSTSKDESDWKRMTPDQRQFVSMQLAFFSRIDIDALDLIDGFAAEIDCMEARQYYIAQAEQECTHADSYAIQIEAIAKGAERDRLLNAARTMPIIADIREWVMRWFDRSIPIGERLVAMAGIEGVLFQGSFCALQDLREKNLLPGITKYNEFIFRDEGVHAEFSCLLVRKYLRRKPDETLVHRIFRDLVENVIDRFVLESLPVRMVGIDAELMMQYVRFRANKILYRMGYRHLYRGVKNPFRFMDKLELNAVNKTNFFEHVPSEYQNVTESGASDLRIDVTPIDDGLDDGLDDGPDDGLDVGLDDCPDDGLDNKF